MSEPTPAQRTTRDLNARARQIQAIQKILIRAELKWHDGNLGDYTAAGQFRAIARGALADAVEANIAVHAQLADERRRVATLEADLERQANPGALCEPFTNA